MDVTGDDEGHDGAGHGVPPWVDALAVAITQLRAEVRRSGVDVADALASFLAQPVEGPDAELVRRLADSQVQLADRQVALADRVDALRTDVSAIRAAVDALVDRLDPELP